MPPRDAPEVEIKNVIRDDWDGTFGGTLGDPVTPSIHHGWVDMDSDQYEVTVSNPDENNILGGQTGWSGIDPSGAGPVRKVDGTVNVNVWARRDWTGTDGNGISNPRQAAYFFKWMVEEIAKDHYDGSNAAGGDTDLSYIVPRGSARLPDTDEDPVVWRYLVTVGYGYRDDR